MKKSTVIPRTRISVTLLKRKGTKYEENNFLMISFLGLSFFSTTQQKAISALFYWIL